jgi:hypothetical protein
MLWYALAVGCRGMVSPAARAAVSELDLDRAWFALR